MELRHGTSLNGGKYQVEKALGQGCFGITYLAMTTDGIAPRKVAIKEFFITDVNERDDDGRTVVGGTPEIFEAYHRRFAKEAQYLAELSHPAIVPVTDIFEENGTSYYVMEFIEGDSIDSYLKTHGRLSEAETLEIIRGIGDALQYMHSHHALHLDIKPRNIMRRPDGSGCLIDFGLAKQCTSDGVPEDETSIGLGTPGYAPLEQASYRAENPIQATLDIYALGATMFKMLTGQRPLEAAAILNEGFPVTPLRAARVTPATIALIRRAMSPTPRTRYPSIRSLLSALPAPALTTTSNPADTTALTTTTSNPADTTLPAPGSFFTRLRSIFSKH